MWLEYAGANFYAGKDEYGTWIVCDENMERISGRLRKSIKDKAKKMMMNEVCTDSLVTIGAWEGNPGMRIAGSGVSISHCTISTNPDTKENNMGESIELGQRDYLNSRAWQIHTKHGDALRTQYHMEMPRFKNFNDLLAALKAGNVEPNNYYWAKDGALRDDYRDSLYADGTYTVIDPLKDEEGYRAAKLALEAAFKTLKDVIAIKTPEAALTELQAFETQTF